MGHHRSTHPQPAQVFPRKTGDVCYPGDPQQDPLQGIGTCVNPRNHDDRPMHHSHMQVDGIEVGPQIYINHQEFSILTWNVQGAGSCEFLYTLKEFIRKYSPKVLMLVETKISGNTVDTVCNKLKFDGRFRVEANGFSGGIWVLWNKEETQLNIVTLSEQYVTMQVSHNLGENWLFSAIYANPHESRREELWTDLEDFSRTNTTPWLLAGDFNETRNMEERRNYSEGLQRRCAKFDHWIENNGLMDLGYSGPRFTWNRGNIPTTRKALCNHQWRLQFEEARVKHLLQNNSDHCLLLISLDGNAPIQKVHRPFRFHVENFEEYLSSKWEQNTPLYPLLGRVAHALDDWNKITFENMFHKRNKLWGRLEDLGRYLGTPTINGRVTKHTFDSIMNRVDKRLAGWKTRILSNAGRLTLVQTVISTIPSFAMQMAKLLRSLCDDIDRKSNRFLWGGIEHHRGVHKVSWETITKTQEEGGFGLQPMRQLNTAFLSKLGWRLLAERNSLWSWILRAKYFQGRRDVNMVSPAKEASNAWRGITENFKNVQHGARFEVGNGSTALFWQHSWPLRQPLTTHALSEIPPQDKDRTVEEYWDTELGWRWEHFIAYLPDNILITIKSFFLSTGTENEDQLVWDRASDGNFSLKSVLGFIRDNDQGEKSPIWQLVWRAQAPQRIRFFLWLCAHDSVMMNVNLFKRGMSSSSYCKSCPDVEETTIHMLRHCPRAHALWTKLVPSTIQDRFFTPSTRDWLVFNLRPPTYIEDNWPMLFATIS
ncbi:hypothetical protein Cgig2_020517 [Carnegiea gigantea]|uniref:Reverse transcriptase zinc-binding domain-containing protein n=1 Tax=Carnegiea gigantea TaxID=171969 RepID=A0A9Q1KAP7_9CARY|nr:hypothetical protein Cgig2_020517 [Carnegiea gigantea]